MGHLPGEVVRTTGQPSPPVFGIWAPGGEPRLPHVIPTELQVNAQRCRPRLFPQSPRLEAVTLRMSSSRRQHERRHPTMTRDGYHGSASGLCLTPLHRANLLHAIDSWKANYSWNSLCIFSKFPSDQTAHCGFDNELGEIPFGSWIGGF